MIIKWIKAFLSREIVLCTIRHQAPDGYTLAPEEPTDAMIDAGLAATAAYLDIKGSALTVNREKMRRRYKAMLAAHTGSTTQ